MTFDVPNFELLHLERELELLWEHLEFVEEQMVKQTDRSENDLEIRLAELEEGSDILDEAEFQAFMSERQMLRHAHEVFVREELPRMLINPFILSLWSLFQTATSELAERARKKVGQDLKFGDINGSYYIERVEKYFGYVLHLPTGFDEKNDSGERIGDRLELIAKIRNAIAHDRGRLEGLEDSLANNIKSGNVVGVSAPEGYYSESEPFILEETFARQALRVVRQYVKALMKRYQEL